MTPSVREQRIRQAAGQYRGIIRDIVAASLYPFAIDQSSHTPWKTEAERRQKLRNLAKLCYMAADEFMAARDE
jgi:hypothetical protein